MRLPVMQHEWQRRQTQRSMWALLGLLALVSAPGMVDQVLPRLDAPPPVAVRVPPAAAPVAPAEREASSRQAVQTRYWRALAPEADGHVRLRLVRCAAQPPILAAHRTWLRRFLRAPTR